MTLRELIIVRDNDPDNDPDIGIRGLLGVELNEKTDNT